MCTVKWALFTGVKYLLVSLSPLNNDHFTTAKLILHRNLSEKIPNREIIAMEISPDIANSETFT